MTVKLWRLYLRLAVRMPDRVVMRILFLPEWLEDLLARILPDGWYVKWVVDTYYAEKLLEAEGSKST